MHKKIRPVGSTEPLFSFVVVADTHVNESDNVCSSPFETNHLANERARFVFEDIAQMEPQPKFVIHLGDIVHPMPALPTFMQAVDQFKQISSQLRCPLHVLPGNHDVGDKRIDWMPADQICEPHLEAYRKAFGKDYYSVDVENIRCVLINSLLINSGLAAEEEQKAWLEEQVNSAQGKRVFLFMHYPPFVYSETEHGSYDNLDEPGRSWLVNLMKKSNVEASFAGHVHNFWYEQLNDSSFYMLPSTAFLRHDYSEFYRIKPEVEFGRGDVAKFGYFIVDVFADCHIAYPVRTMGVRTSASTQDKKSSIQYLTNPKSSHFNNVGVELRHTWTEVAQIPATGGVQEFGRKSARNDYPLLALWEMGARLSKVTDQDALDIQTNRRMQLLAKMGHRFLLTALGTPKTSLISANLEAAGVTGIETNLSTARFQSDLERLKAFKDKTNIDIYWCKIHTYDDSHYDGKHFSHFVKSGFTIGDLTTQASLIKAALTTKIINGITVRVEHDQDLLTVAPLLNTFAKEYQCKIVASLKLSGPSIAQSNDDEAALIEKVCLAMLYSKGPEAIQYIFDTFMDVDRGYYPRRAFIDRQFNPNVAAHVFAHINSIFSNTRKISIDTSRSKTGSHIVFKADDQEHQIHFGDASTLAATRSQLKNVTNVIDLTANGREQISTLEDTTTSLNSIQTHPEINAVLFSLK
ncbi:metallophosphoesterase [Zwartia panacis]|uniref:metallophosphoesterase n=1 Tax=Zwartia panacis TaxID=2683345 RepID=UPI0025B461B7|nr:metallophosphoesterase [Zwartia panacis]MDN4016370.1 metallophosphoesterase [Zwartia panacis]